MSWATRSDDRRVRHGNFDRQVTILRFTSTIDPGSGQPIQDWSELTTVFASWRRASSNETLAAAEVSAVVTDVFETHWSSVMATVTAEDRLLFGGREYNLIPPEEIGRRKGIRLRGNARAE